LYTLFWIAGQPVNLIAWYTVSSASGVIGQAQVPLSVIGYWGNQLQK
jgi:hypothetical protein